MIKIGILNLQGAVSEHLEMTQKTIERMNMENEIIAIPVRYADEVAQCNGIIISGGESTVIGKLIKERGIDKVIKDNQIPVFGTCAGMVLLSKKTDYDQEILGIMDVEVKRNAFGRQKDSFENEVNIFGTTYPGVFIRAPAVSSILDSNADNNLNNEDINAVNNLDKVEILSELDSNIVAVKQGNNMAMSFHPELTCDTRLHEYYLNEVIKLNKNV
ncbi:pyridoxal 5'-phosphate synthase glutaminase subunit PdxT [Methanobrevibacter sp. TMH8]|uniref:pyridoxal 5'-phosphate synthase glutaminase subunit PdxT n=1 Tax=Methanobrevibacter sp. TMH8 TaxID=2848611 RepID=UPI001CCB4136|nr:pyridoxal 5'-phosphate synthase glutaminase subunit PdxT [Methanobrevibacter sp. TMH8]MBZ9570721.1 pyridoxal 5'-phosphate synthase glutaminase subunit PdxT [Methanobrevibacter sp. TMH8]